jgi:DNA-binding response OmpR family regulator
MQPPSTTVLVVEDDDLVSGVIERTLDAARYKCTVVGRGDDALAQLDAPGARWDAVVLDLSLPDQRGDEVLRQIRARSATLPVVLSSGHDERSVARETLAAASVFLQKPFRGHELIAAVERALGR